jgi:tetratricopeptide (TPR) repeat protein
MKTSKIFVVFSLLLVFLMSGCMLMRISSEVQSGRWALNVGDPKAAIPHFEAAAGLAPDYIANYDTLEIGIWSYVGRAYYEAGDKAKALEALKRARKQYEYDYFARTYLGLVMSENGSREAAKAELEGGLSGLQHWLETISGRIQGGHYWDPGRDLHKTIVQTRGLLNSENVQWAQVSKNVRWLGQAFDEEPERVRQDKRQDMSNESKGGKSD